MTEKLFEKVKNFMLKHVSYDFLQEQKETMSEQELIDLCIERSYDFAENDLSDDEICEVGKRLYMYLYNFMYI